MERRCKRPRPTTSATGSRERTEVRYTGRSGVEAVSVRHLLGYHDASRGGALVMAHGDDRGLRLPRAVAPAQRRNRPDLQGRRPRAYPRGGRGDSRATHERRVSHHTRRPRRSSRVQVPGLGAEGHAASSRPRHARSRQRKRHARAGATPSRRSRRTWTRSKRPCANCSTRFSHSCRRKLGSAGQPRASTRRALPRWRSSSGRRRASPPPGGADRPSARRRSRKRRPRPSAASRSKAGPGEGPCIVCGRPAAERGDLGAGVLER